MKYLRVNFNRYQRKLSWKIRPAFFLINENGILNFATYASIVGIVGALV